MNCRMMQKILRELYDESGWIIGHVDRLLSGEQIRVEYEIKSRNGGCNVSVGWQRVPNGSTTVAEGLFPKIGPGQWKMDTGHRSLHGTMTMSG